MIRMARRGPDGLIGTFGDINGTCPHRPTNEANNLVPLERPYRATVVDHATPDGTNAPAIPPNRRDLS
jgi:hypothetical protein